MCTFRHGWIQELSGIASCCLCCFLLHWTHHPQIVSPQVVVRWPQKHSKTSSGHQSPELDADWSRMGPLLGLDGHRALPIGRSQILGPCWEGVERVLQQPRAHWGWEVRGVCWEHLGWRWGSWRLHGYAVRLACRAGLQELGCGLGSEVRMWKEGLRREVGAAQWTRCQRWGRTRRVS